jgi:hypothetical protein
MSACTITRQLGRPQSHVGRPCPRHPKQPCHMAAHFSLLNVTKLTAMSRVPVARQALLYRPAEIQLYSCSQPPSWMTPSSIKWLRSRMLACQASHLSPVLPCNWPTYSKNDWPSSRPKRWSRPRQSHSP